MKTVYSVPRGPLMCGVEGLVLTDADRRRLQHPQMGGVILFSRNVKTAEQVRSLCAEIRALRAPALVVGIDQEGGRVQRLRGEGFIDVPPMRTLGERFTQDPDVAEQEAHHWGRVIGNELRHCGIDFSFTPVLDLDYGRSAVIGDRAFAASPETVARLAGALRRGLNELGCAAVGKHFPGHGWVEADSHHALPIDQRDWAALDADLIPYRALIADGLESVMMAHVVYPEFDALPAGYSAFWVQDVLRRQLAFDGLVFSDDLGMVGAQSVGDWVARADAALLAGCDAILACNEFDAIDDILMRWRPLRSESQESALQRRWHRMVAR